ncbi:unnamed protein product, partial [Hapterophycus canaliculatus]
PAFAAKADEKNLKLGGLSKQRRLMNQWKDSPDQVIAMYPSWFAPEIADENESDRFYFVDFPLDDGIERATSNEPLPTDRPLLVTTGSAHHGDRVFIDKLADECQRRKIPLVVCCPSNPDLFADATNFRSVGYIPLGQWLPYCQALIHHGGVGTTSRAINAEIPQMIRPMAFDQHDHAQRIERFGLGVWLRNDRELAAGLDQLLSMTNRSLPQYPLSFEETAAERAAKLI